MQHSQESHPGLIPGAVSVCEEKADELTKLMEKLDNENSPVPESEGSETLSTPNTATGVLKKPGAPRSKFKTVESAGGLEEMPFSSESSLSDENSDAGSYPNNVGENGDLPEEELSVYRCKRCLPQLFTGDQSQLRDHVLRKHLRHRLYVCDFCDASRNDIEAMIQHIQNVHPDKEQRFSHAYGKFKDEIDKVIEKADAINVSNENTTDSQDTVESEGNDKHYQCGRCNNFTGSVDSTRDHVVKAHFRHRLYTCDVCDVSKTDMESIIQHIKKSHPGPEVNFTYAYDKFKQEIDDAIMPVRETKEIKQDVTKCPACGTPCRNMADLDWHLAEDHPEFVKYQCRYCSTVTATKHELKDHMISKHPEKPPDYTFIRNLPTSMEAGLSGGTSVSRRSSTGSGKAVLPPVVKECKLCNFSADCVASLNNHMESSHLSQVLFKCRLCSGLHKSKDDLYTHYGVLHQNDSLQYKVVPLGMEDESDSESSSRNSLSSRNSIDEESRKKSMSVTKPTARKSTTQVAISHRVVKSQIPPSFGRMAARSVPVAESKAVVIRYECKHCNYETKECVSIRRHVMTHVNYKPYSCPVCNVSSIRSNSIKNHIKTHHKECTAAPK